VADIRQVHSVLAVLVFVAVILFATQPSGMELSEKELWWVHPNFDKFGPRVIAVLPMDNLSYEPDVEKALYREVYGGLTARGYIRISAEKVRDVMERLGIQTPGQLAAISMERLARELNCDAVLVGQIEQSGAIHAGVYDAVVVSCSLRLLHCSKERMVIWKVEQWRTAHRQWQIDPINLFINVAAHEKASREKRVAWLVHEMLKTLPRGPVNVEIGDLLNQAQEIRADEK
jgi:hypothetical protein